MFWYILQHEMLIDIAKFMRRKLCQYIKTIYAICKIFYQLKWQTF